jgi:putative nucleotide binding protein
MEEREQRREDLEEYAAVLDYLPIGRSSSARAEPLVQLLGETRFTLLEAVPKGTEIKVGETVYIGKGDREKVSLIKSRLSYADLTEGAKKELPIAISAIVKKNEKKFVEMFNNAGALNIRMHSLELLPNVGKKHLAAILDARDERPFESFADITARVSLLQDPIKLIVERVIVELKGESRFYLLTKPPAASHEHEHERGGRY